MCFERVCNIDKSASFTYITDVDIKRVWLRPRVHAAFRGFQPSLDISKSTQ